MPKFRHVASIVTVGAGVASLSVFSATAVGAAVVDGGGSTNITNSGNNNGNTTQSNSASTSGACSPVQQQNNRDINNSNDVTGGNGGKGGKGGNGGSPPRMLQERITKIGGGGNINAPIASPGTGNGNSAGGKGGNGGNGGNASGSANAANQVQVVSNCGNTTVSPVRNVVVNQVVTRTVTVQARAAAPVVSTAHFTG